MLAQNNPQEFLDDEINLAEIIRPIFNNWRKILSSGITFCLIGILYSLSVPNIFTAKTAFITQTGSQINSGSAISGLASLAGINMARISNSSDIPQELYPQILSSVPYMRKLLAQGIEFKGDSILIGEYFLNDHKIRYSSAGTNSFRFEENNYFKITLVERELFDVLKSNLILSSSSNGVLTLEFSDKNNSIAAQIVDRATELLQMRIIEFKNQAARESLLFATRQYEDNKVSYERLQDSLAVFKDQNLNISSSLYQNRLDRLEKELDIASSIAEQLASYVEQAKLQLNRDTPVFTVIDPVTIPYQRSSPKRKLIVLGFTFLGLFSAIVLTIIKVPLIKFWELLAKEK
jgi:uncharacterized protein involved in exopolysaccharide biosynthesis